jgi:hypothetical protein
MSTEGSIRRPSKEVRAVMAGRAFRQNTYTVIVFNQAPAIKLRYRTTRWLLLYFDMRRRCRWNSLVYIHIQYDSYLFLICWVWGLGPRQKANLAIPTAITMLAISTLKVPVAVLSVVAQFVDEFSPLIITDFNCSNDPLFLDTHQHMSRLLINSNWMHHHIICG